MKKDVALIIVAMLVVFSSCACSIGGKVPAEENLGAQERTEGNYISTAKKFTKDLGNQILTRMRKALGVRAFQSDNLGEASGGCLKDLTDAICEKGRTFAGDIGFDFLYRGFCLYSPFSLLL